MAQTSNLTYDLGMNMDEWDDQDFYELLEVDQEAGYLEIKEAYNKAKSTYSNNNPAIFSIFTPEETKQLLNLIEDAYAVLSHPQKREQYNNALSNRMAEADSGAQTSYRAMASGDGIVISEYGQDLASDGLSVLSSDGEFKVDEVMEQTIKAEKVFSGKFLKMVREYKNISLDLMSRKTKISKKHLRSIEDEDVNQLPVKVYVRGFLIQIAKNLGLDQEKVINSYLSLLYNNDGEF